MQADSFLRTPPSHMFIPQEDHQPGNWRGQAGRAGFPPSDLARTGHWPGLLSSKTLCHPPRSQQGHPRTLGVFVADHRLERDLSPPPGGPCHGFRKQVGHVVTGLLRGAGKRCWEQAAEGREVRTSDMGSAADVWKSPV